MLKKLFFAGLVVCFYNLAIAQSEINQKSGIQIVTSGGKDAEQRFIELLGGADAKVIFIPTPASALRSDSGIIWNPDEEKNKI